MKKIASVLFAVAFAGTVWAENSADVLVWYVDTTEDAISSWEEGPREFDTIKFWAVDVNDSNNKIDLAGRTYVNGQALVESSSAAGTGDTITVPNEIGPTTTWGEYYTNLSGLETGYSFWMELYRGDEKVDWMQLPVTWDQFEEYMLASSDLVKDFDLQPANGLYNFASTMIPEPSSNLLLLIGGALLALRRRRRG